MGDIVRRRVLGWGKEGGNDDDDDDDDDDDNDCECVWRGGIRCIRCVSKMSMSMSEVW